MSTSARAVRISKPGGPEVLSVEALEVRDPGPTEVLVEVAAAGLNRADCLQRRGVYPAPVGTVQDVPGLEYAGHVVRVGSEVQTRKVGDRVMAISAGGSMATHIVAHERELLPVPEGMELSQAAAIPEAFMTAYDALFIQASVGMGQYVLIHAAASGVGTAALQLVRAAGGIAIGTSRKPEKLERLGTFGLEHGIATPDGSFAQRVKEITRGRLAQAVLDTIGGKYLAENLRAVAVGGTIVTIGLLGGATAELSLGLLVAKRALLRGSVLRSRPLEEKLGLAKHFRESVLPLFEQHSLRPVVEDVMPMAEVGKAHTRMESDDLFGKLVLTW